MAKDVGAKVETSKYTGRVGVTGKVIGKVEKAPVSTWAAAKRDRVEGSFGRAVNAIADASHASSDANISNTADAHLRAAKAYDRAAEVVKSRGGDHEHYAREADGHREKAAKASDLPGRMKASAEKMHGAAYAASDKANQTGKAADHVDAAQSHARAAGQFPSGDPRKRAHLDTAANHKEAARTGAKAAGVSGDDRPRDERGRFASK